MREWTPSKSATVAPRMSKRSSRSKSARGKRPRPLRILITAGPTREYIDPVRYLSNESSGKMGFAIAAAAARRGHRVTLVHGPVLLPPPRGVQCRAVVSADEMLAACRAASVSQHVLIMAAAVADYRPARQLPSKMKKTTDALTLALAPTVDVLKSVAARRPKHQVAIGFALEDRHGRARAEEKLRRKKLDAIILNQPAALSADRSTIEVLDRDSGWIEFGEATKRRHAGRIVKLAERLAANLAKL